MLEILDARAPFSSKNPLTEKIIKNQTKIILLHKSDIAQITEIIKWKKYFENLGNTVIISNIYKKGMRKQIIDNIKNWQLLKR